MVSGRPFLKLRDTKIRATDILPVVEKDISAFIKEPRVLSIFSKHFQLQHFWRQPRKADPDWELINPFTIGVKKRGPSFQ
jgi:hypothetical protein